MRFFCRSSDPYGSRHNTESKISDPNGSLVLLRRRIYDPVDLSVICEGWIYDPNGSGIRILGIRSRDPFSGSTGMSAYVLLSFTCVNLATIGQFCVLQMHNCMHFMKFHHEKCRQLAVRFRSVPIRPKLSHTGCRIYMSQVHTTRSIRHTS